MKKSNSRKYIRVPAPDDEATLVFYKPGPRGEGTRVHALTVNMSYSGKAVIVVSPDEIHEGEIFIWKETKSVESLWKVVFAKQIDIGVWRLGLQIMP